MSSDRVFSLPHYPILTVLIASFFGVNVKTEVIPCCPDLTNCNTAVRYGTAIRDVGALLGCALSQVSERPVKRKVWFCEDLTPVGWRPGNGLYNGKASV